jgi:hypothetical protein
MYGKMSVLVLFFETRISRSVTTTVVPAAPVLLPEPIQTSGAVLQGFILFTSDLVTDL